MNHLKLFNNERDRKSFYFHLNLFFAEVIFRGDGWIGQKTIGQKTIGQKKVKIVLRLVEKGRGCQTEFSVSKIRGFR